jgi:hypothetical protein
MLNLMPSSRNVGLQKGRGVGGRLLGVDDLFLSTFVYCTVSLIKDANRQYREERKMQHNRTIHCDAGKRCALPGARDRGR